METKLLLPSQNWSHIHSGDIVYVSGKLYVARDQAHKLLVSEIKEKGETPFPFEGNAVYYMGPSPTKEGMAIGSSGPTTSRRMDEFSPFLISKGLKIMIGKGPRSEKVVEAVKEYGGLYLQAFGGCGALYASRTLSSRTLLYPFLGPEAVLELEVKDFPTICIIDSMGEVFKP